MFKCALLSRLESADLLEPHLSNAHWSVGQKNMSFHFGSFDLCRFQHTFTVKAAIELCQISI